MSHGSAFDRFARGMARFVGHSTAFAAAAVLIALWFILTTDLRSFWAKREVVLEHGLEVGRASDALRAYIPRWNAQEEEFAHGAAPLRRGSADQWQQQPSRMAHARAGQEQWCSANPVAGCTPNASIPTHPANQRDLTARRNPGVDARGTADVRTTFGRSGM
jgi:hypothetical protein